MIKHRSQHIDFSRVLLLALMLVSAGLFVGYDYSRVNGDFHNVMSLLSHVRNEAIQKDRHLIARFNDKGLVVKDAKANSIYAQLDIPTLHAVNYDTTLGTDMIVFTELGTSPYNTTINGGDLLLKSWLGFKKSIAVNCTGYVSEGKYPAE